ncbi:hypothetical protein AVEN_235167-1 [Araneus ventricosus]|uniref:Uncharacterized protein n=1 Tax=Araneus ventricosus TaxID=182803 RepID=A0A4Y2H7L4_ARAVE|nr:hypothetical protein AVEN_235167-1 [Araneus ventricosus]
MASNITINLLNKSTSTPVIREAIWEENSGSEKKRLAIFPSFHVPKRCFGLSRSNPSSPLNFLWVFSLMPPTIPFSSSFSPVTYGILYDK